MPDPPVSSAAQPERSGEDARRRGWFWHWNTIITQFAPLIGLKGVGLLNSYTVWTDRREQSPYRGYAFPSQQAEAAFYGEDRAELITINKILVALDLIEIRKEMVTRTDEAGRRWRVPHNFYRVKDRPDGFVLTPEALLRVVELATRDGAVYRYIRHIFSSRFAPIDRENVWHEILPIVRQHPLWQQLAARVATEEARTSARTRSGHTRRKGAATKDTTSNPGGTDVALSNGGSTPTVATSNSGSATSVAMSNHASVESEQTIVGPSNREEASYVAPCDTTYHQRTPTTTTTTPWPPPSEGAGPLLEPSPEVLQCYEAANARPASPLERTLLAELQREFQLLASARGESSAELLIAAIREAVASGSRYVAPKRIREILLRWSRRSLRAGARATLPVNRAGSEREGGSLERRLQAEAVERLFALLEETLLARPVLLDSVSSPSCHASEQQHRQASPLPPSLEEEMPGSPATLNQLEGTERQRNWASVVTDSSTETELDSDPRVPTTSPETQGSGRTLAPLWSLAQELLSERLPSAAYAECIRPARLLAASSPNEYLLGVPTAGIRQQIERRWLGAISEVLTILLHRPVTVRVVLFGEWLT